MRCRNSLGGNELKSFRSSVLVPIQAARVFDENEFGWSEVFWLAECESKTKLTAPYMACLIGDR